MVDHAVSCWEFPKQPTRFYIQEILWDPVPHLRGPLVPAWRPHRPLELLCFPVRHSPPCAPLADILLPWLLMRAVPPLHSAVTQSHLLRGVLPGHPEQPSPSTSIICLGRELDRTSTHSFLLCLFACLLFLSSVCAKSVFVLLPAGP